MSTDIAIVIPAYNRVELLELCLASVRRAVVGVSNQVIIVDDGSEPPLAGQLEQFSDLHPTIVRQQNQGLIAAKNAGLEHVKAEFVLFLDSDDLIQEEKLHIHLAALRVSGADVSYSDVRDACLQGGEVKLLQTRHYPNAEDPMRLYLQVRPAPHAPIYRTTYLQKALQTPIVAAAERYNSIGEVWMYYNLAVCPAKIIKVPGHLSYILQHTEDRITNNWERLGVSALLLNLDYFHALPADSESRKIRQCLGELSLATLRRMPIGSPTLFEELLFWLWQHAPRGPRKNLGGKYFVAASYALGVRGAVSVFRRLTQGPYAAARHASDTELAEMNQQLRDAIERHGIKF